VKSSPVTEIVATDKATASVEVFIVMTWAEWVTRALATDTERSISAGWAEGIQLFDPIKKSTAAGAVAFLIVVP
jgi:hypothetical protein